MTSPVEILERAIECGLSDHHRLRRYPTPGAVVASLPTADRETLTQLRARDIASLRRDVVALYVEKDRSRELRLTFDRTLRRGAV